jgi:hypothetical protein
VNAGQEDARRGGGRGRLATASPPIRTTGKPPEVTGLRPRRKSGVHGDGISWAAAAGSRRVLGEAGDCSRRRVPQPCTGALASPQPSRPQLVSDARSPPGGARAETAMPTWFRRRATRVLDWGRGAGLQSEDGNGTTSAPAAASVAVIAGTCIRAHQTTPGRIRFRAHFSMHHLPGLGTTSVESSGPRSCRAGKIRTNRLQPGREQSVHVRGLRRAHEASCTSGRGSAPRPPTVGPTSGFEYIRRTA